MSPHTCFSLLLLTAGLLAQDPGQTKSLHHEPVVVPAKAFPPPATRTRREDPPVPAAPIAPPAKTPLPAGAARPRVPTGIVWYDRDDQGTLWARGDDYKAAFGADGARFVPFLGSQAPRNFPVRFLLLGVRSGDLDVALVAPGPFVRHGTRVERDHGPVREVYELRPEGMEQRFVVTQPLGAGDLVVRIAVETELLLQQDHDGLGFAGEFGGVRYGAAAILEPSGHKTPLSTQAEDLDGGSLIAIRVPGAELAARSFPLTIDPLVTSFRTYNPTSRVEHAPDLAFEGGSGRFLLVWEVDHSATDHDVAMQMVDRNGAVVPGSFDWIDLSVADWRHPRVASNRLHQNFLVVAERQGNNLRSIIGRLRSADLSLPTGNYIDISEFPLPIGTVHTNPDVGGDPSLIAPTYYLVVWQNNLDAFDHDIEGRLIGAVDGTPRGPFIPIDNTISADLLPAISKTNGANLLPDQQEWIVTWTRLEMFLGGDIHAARVGWNGVPRGPSFSVDSDFRDDTRPTVSSLAYLQDGTTYWLAAWDGSTSISDRDIFGRLFRGSTPVGSTVNLTRLIGVEVAQNQIQAHLDAGGCRFVLVHSELYRGSTTDYDVFASTLHLRSDLTLGVSAAHETIAFESLPEGEPRIACAGQPLYGIAYRHQDDIAGATYLGQGAGGFLRVATGCQGLGFTASGPPRLGETVLLQMTGQGSDLAFWLFGPPLPTPAPVCAPCALGVDPAGLLSVLSGATFRFPIPLDGRYVGMHLAAQGFTYGRGGSCLGALRLTDTMQMTIQ